MLMPKFAILLTQQDEYKWWSYALVVNHKPVPNLEHYATPQAAMAAALLEANRRGLYQ